LPRNISRFGAASPYVTMRGAILGSWTSAQESALNAILNDSLPRIYTGSSGYGVEWIKQVAPLTKDQVKRIIRAAMYYFSLGYPNSREGYLQFKRPLQKSLSDIDPMQVAKVVMLITGITKDNYPADYALLKTGQVNKDLQAQQSNQQWEEKKADIAYEVKDKIDRGATAIFDAAGSAAKTINSALPWYLKPTTLIPVAAVGALAYFWLQKKGISTLLGRGYSRNPITKREAAKKTYEVFHDRKPKKTIALPEIDTSELVQLGQALEIGYRSNKWTGKKTNYLHKFDKGVRVMCTADRKTLIIHGGQMEIQDVGIVH